MARKATGDITLGKKDLVLALQNELNKDPVLYGFYKRVTGAVAQDIFQLVVDLIATSIRDNDAVYLNELGTLKHRMYKPRRFRHPVTGEYAILPERDVIVFVKAGNFCENSDRRLKEVVQQPLFDLRGRHRVAFEDLFGFDEEDCGIDFPVDEDGYIDSSILADDE